LQDGLILNTRNFLKSDRKSKNIIMKKICDMIERAGEKNSPYEYYPDSVKKAMRLFDFNRFYLTQNGYAFYYDCGRISNYNNSFPVFVLPYSDIPQIANKENPFGTKHKTEISERLNPVI